MRLDFNEVFGKAVVNTLLTLFWGMTIALALIAYAQYSGKGYIYFLFTIASCLLLCCGFRKNAIFFDTFIGTFLWLGFWLKLTIRVAFFDGVFHEPVGHFNGTGGDFDRALLVASCGLFGFLLASYVREKIFFNYPGKMEHSSQNGFFYFYLNYRKLIWAGFAVLVVLVAATNAYWGIYQRGSITRTVLPFGLNGVYKWFLLFGLASISTLIIRFEFQIKRKTFLPAMVLAFFELLVSNISLLSRGMVLNGGAIMYGTLVAVRSYSIKSSWKFFFIAGLIFSVLFISSVFAVNYLRSTIYTVDSTDSHATHIDVAHRMTAPLFIDRWVGMEGVMAVSSYSSLGWDLWNGALQEVYNENDTSFYDNNLIKSAYENTDKTKHHFISLPGAIAFFFYPGSFLFLFVCMFALGTVAALIEIFVYYFGGRNLILCALIAQVIAFRFASFGYVPKQSYLLFGAILLNILIIFFADKFLSRFYSKRTLS